MDTINNMIINEFQSTDVFYNNMQQAIESYYAQITSGGNANRDTY